MVGSKEMDAPHGLWPGGEFEGMRFLGDNNNNNNNNNNGNNNNNNNNNNGNNNGNNNNNNNGNNNQNYNYNNNGNNNQNYNNNGNNNQGNNQQQYYNDNYYLNSDFDARLFVGTIAVCALISLFVVVRVKCHRKKERKRKRLGLSRKTARLRKRSTADDTDDNILTDDEIRKFVLPSKQEASLQEAAKVVRCDRETDRIMDICRPFWISSFVSGIADVINTVLLGKELGVDALAIYYIATVPTAFSDTIIWAVLDTVTSLGGQAIGVGSYKLTGQYCQISIILYTILFIPHAIFWCYYLKPCLRWFAPDLSDDIVNEGYDYFLVGLVHTYISSYSTVLHSLLEVTDHYRYGMYSSIAGEITGIGGFLAYLRINPYARKSIVWVEAIDTIWCLVYLIIDVVVAKKMKWFDGFWKGMLRSVAMRNWQAVWLVLKTAAPLSVGNILITVEWEMLAIFAARMGESYVASWGIVGTIWGVLEYCTDCVAAAGEIRVAKLMGNGNARLAKLSAYKCLFLGSFFASLMSIGFVIGLPFIPNWFTDDEFVIAQIANLLPYCALGNITLTVGSLAWTLVGAQGRYSIATFHGCVGSLLFTIPCAVLSTYYLDLGLPGLAASVVVGYMISGAFNTITLILSDWEYIAYRVMIRNGATEPVEEEIGDEGRWGVFNYMNKTIEDNFIDDDDTHRSKINDMVLGDTLDDGSMMSGNTDSSMSFESKPVPSRKAPSWWPGFELVKTNDNETRKVIIGPGKLGYTIQSTEQGPMIVGVSEDTGGFRLFRRVEPDQYRAKIIKGEIYLGDIIVQINDIRTDRMKGKSLAKHLHRLQNETVRILTVSHREGTGLTTVYQPGPYGSAAIAGVIENAKGMNDDEFEDEGVIGAGYWNMGMLS